MLNNLQARSLDPIFQLLGDYIANDNPHKVNLGIGIYADEAGNPFVFPSIKKSFTGIDVDNFNYQPIGGNKDFLALTVKAILGDDWDIANLALQTTCGGTQACRIFADLMVQDEVRRELLVGAPTWGNHYAIFAGLPIKKFEHLNENGVVNFAAYQQAITDAKPGSILLLHGGPTHNPTGRNLSLEQIHELLPLLKAKQIVVFIDAAYLGFGDGFAEDCEYVRTLFTELEDVACGVSYSKNASLYEHRTGALMIKTDRKNVLESQVQQLARESISMAPGAGQEVMIEVLGNNRAQWLKELEEVRISIDKRKSMLVERLPETFRELLDTRGMFGFLKLTSDQIERLREDYAIYILPNTRVNFGGIKIVDIEYLADSINAVL